EYASGPTGSRPPPARCRGSPGAGARAAAIAAVAGECNPVRPSPVQAMVTVRPSRPTHARSETRAADAAPHTVRDGRCRAVAGAGDRRERGDLLSVRPAPARGAARERAGAAREPRRAGPEVRLDLVQQRRELRQRLQLPDVPGPGARADRVRGPGRAPLVRREPRLAWPDAERLRD